MKKYLLSILLLSTGLVFADGHSADEKKSSCSIRSLF